MNIDQFLDVEELAHQKIQKGSLKRLFDSVRVDSKILILGLLLVLLGSAAMLLEPWLFGYAIDRAILPKDISLLDRLVILFFGIETVRVITLMGQGYCFEVLGARTMQRLRLKLFSHLESLPISIFDKNPVGRLVTRVTNDISAVSEMFTSGAITILLNILFVAGTMIAIFILNWRLGCVVGSVIPILLGLCTLFSRRLRVSYRTARSRLSAMNAFLAEAILGIRSLHLFNRQALQLKRFKQVNQWYADATVATIRNYAYFQPIITVSAGAAMALVIYFGGKYAFPGFVSSHAVPVGVLSAYFAYVSAMFQPMREIADRWNVFLSGMASAERIFSILDWKPEIEKLSSLPSPGLKLRGDIQFENVWFAYDSWTKGSREPRWVLKDFSLHLRAGMKLGVVGHTGAGKTTLISLLMRFYEPQRGRILIDGRDIRDYDRRQLRATIGLVQQDVFLFSGAIQDNITLWKDPNQLATGRMDATLAELGYPQWSVRGERAQKLDERGSNLSQGERQVLALMRAIAQEPSIWILDEATANVDSGTEQRLSRELSRSARGQTMIMIAHRLATVRDADLLIVLHHGKIVEQGTHSELMGREGVYSRMHQYQRVLEEGSQIV